MLSHLDSASPSPRELGFAGARGAPLCRRGSWPVRERKCNGLQANATCPSHKFKSSHTSRRAPEQSRPLHAAHVRCARFRSAPFSYPEF
ncbi:unnamed protein product, partial [Iphiclides podalirius]